MPAFTRPVRVGIVSDYELIVAGAAKMLAPYRDRVEIVELDGRVPGTSSVDILLFDTFAHVAGDSNDLRDLVRPGGPKVVVFAWAAHRASVESALVLGAAGYLSKALGAADLVQALEDIHTGSVVISDPGAATRDGGPEGGRQHERELSPREAEVLALIARGLSNKEIARSIFLSVNSVKTHIRSAYSKIGVHSRSQAVVWALDHGLDARADRIIT